MTGKNWSSPEEVETMLSLWRSWSRPHPSNVRDEFLALDDPDIQMLEFGNWSLRVWEGFLAQRQSAPTGAQNSAPEQEAERPLGGAACCASSFVEEWGGIKVGVNCVKSIRVIGENAVDVIKEHYERDGKTFTKDSVTGEEREVAPAHSQDSSGRTPLPDFSSFQPIAGQGESLALPDHLTNGGSV